MDQTDQTDHGVADARLTALQERVTALGDRPLEDHPGVLDEVHRALQAELAELDEG